MATVRAHIRIAASADDVWKVVSDAGGVSEWMTAAATSRCDGDTRVVGIVNGPEVVEEIVTSDPVLRRFQYAVRSGLPVTSHLATVDVIDEGEGCLVVYGTDVTPDALASVLGRGLMAAVADLKSYAEGPVGTRA